MKRIISRETLLSYPDFTAPFDIHTNASDLQLGAVISQRGKPIAFIVVNLIPLNSATLWASANSFPLSKLSRGFAISFWVSPSTFIPIISPLLTKHVPRILYCVGVSCWKNTILPFIIFQANVTLSLMPSVGYLVFPLVSRRNNPTPYKFLMSVLERMQTTFLLQLSPFAMLLLPKLNTLILLFSVNWISLMLLFIGRLFVEAVNPMIQSVTTTKLSFLEVYVHG